MITCAIIDDEPLAVKLLENYVRQTPFLELRHTLSSAVEAAEVLQSQPVDLVFLDIQMPELNGLEFARFLPERTRIIFTTAFNTYAVDSYRVNALDYLVKPISYSDFLTAARRAEEWFALQRRAEEHTATPTDTVHDTTPAKSTTEEESVFVKSEYKLVRIRKDDILYIEGLKDYIKIYTESHPKPILSLTAMHAIEQSLPPTRFLRIHRSFIVNMEKVSLLERGQIVFGEKVLPISESNKEKVQEYINKRMIAK